MNPLQLEHQPCIKLKFKSNNKTGQMRQDLIIMDYKSQSSLGAKTTLPPDFVTELLSTLSQSHLCWSEGRILLVQAGLYR